MTPAAVETRAARPEEADDLLRVLCAAFGLPYDVARPIFYQDPFFDLSHKRILRTAEDGLVSCLTVIPTRIRVGAAWVRMGGIAGVATLPECQGRGYAGRLLTATVSALALEPDMGYPLGGLFAYAEDYYRRLGWESVSQIVRHAGELAALPDCAEAGHVRCLDADAADDGAREAVHRLHAAQTPARTGACVRDDRRWHVIERMSPGRVWVLFQAPGEAPTGYAAYVLDGGGLHLLEMHGATPPARRGLVGYLSRQRGRASRWDWPAAPADWEAFGPHFPAATERAEAGLMLRLTDTQAALAAVHAANLAPHLAPSGRALTVRAVDALRPGVRPVRLTAAGVEPGGDADPEWIAADIRVLAQCYFGCRTPSDAQARSALRASSPAALALADALFPARAPCVAPLDQF